VKKIEELKLSNSIKKNYKIDNNSFTKCVKDLDVDRLEVEVGDIKQSEFYPQVKLKRWDNEVNFSARLVDDDNSEALISSSDDKITWEKNNTNIKFYELSSTEDLPDGGYEFEIILKEKPKTNVITFTLQTKGLEFFYQPELTEEEKKTATRSDNVVGSYAVYYKDCPNNITGGKEYKSGKAFHIYRPKVQDANGAWVWGELNINLETNLMTVTIPQNFLDDAVYPVRHAAGATFGYTSQGASTGTHYDRILSTWWTLSSDGGLVDSMSCYGNASATTQRVWKMALYTGTSSPYTLLGSTDEGTFSTTLSWQTLNFSTKPTIVNGTKYACTSWGDYNSDYLKYDSSGVASSSVSASRDYSSAAGVFYNPWTVTFNAANRYSIYATYTPGAPDQKNYVKANLYIKDINYSQYTKARLLTAEANNFVKARITTAEADSVVKANIKKTLPSPTPPWYNSNWSRRIKITIDHTKIINDRTDLCLRVKLGDLSTRGIFDNINVDGSDLRVTKFDGVTELPVEVAAIDTVNKTGELFLKLTGTTSSTVDSYFYIYFGNTSATAYEVTDTYGRNAVWSNYLAVYHFEISAVDSTGNSTQTELNTTYTTGYIGNGLSLAGTGYDISTSTAASLGSAFTLSMFVKSGNSVPETKFFLRDAAGATDWGLYFGQLNGKYTYGIKSDTWHSYDTTTGVNTAFYDFMSLSYNGTNYDLYKNGTSIYTATPAGSTVDTANKEFRIGCLTTALQLFTGYLDEIRVSKSADNGSIAEFNNMYAAGGFNSFFTAGNVEYLIEGNLVKSFIIKLPPTNSSKANIVTTYYSGCNYDWKLSVDPTGQNRGKQ